MRVDILERLADLIRPAIAYRPGTTPGDPPPGTADGDGFVVTVAMTSLAGCSGESFAAILRALGYQSEQRQGPAISVPLLPKAAIEPVAPAAPSESAAEHIVVEAAESAAAPDAVVEPESVDSFAAPMDAAPADEAAEVAEAAAPEEPVAEPEPAAEAILAEAAAEPASGEAEPAAAAADGAAVEAAAEASPSEPATIEVWRPFRHRQARRPARPQRHAARSHRPPQAAAAAAEAGAPPTASEMPPLEHRRPPRRHRPGAEAAAAGGAHRPDDRRDKKRDFSSKEPHRGARNGETRGKGQWSSAERPRERQPDPNSPFAKLAILKQRMEEGKT